MKHLMALMVSSTSAITPKTHTPVLPEPGLHLYSDAGSLIAGPLRPGSTPTSPGLLEPQSASGAYAWSVLFHLLFVTLLPFSMIVAGRYEFTLAIWVYGANMFLLA